MDSGIFVDMGKLIAAINMTLDGFCDHTAVIADDELHRHYSGLLQGAGAILYGRITYQLMEYWKTVVENPTGNSANDKFAVIMDRIPKFVFSRTLKELDWHSSTLAKQGLAAEVSALKQRFNKDIFVGSPGLIVSLTNLKLIDEYQLCVHPVVAGNGLPLFKDVAERMVLQFLKSKTFGSGAVVLYYERA